ncbi:MAG: DUF2752 domain-containing protein [Treponema sp.]|nr:DUF2752 domain-containing protein [Treponema sp.]
MWLPKSKEKPSPKSAPFAGLLPGNARFSSGCRRRLLVVIVLGALFFLVPKAYLGDTFPLCAYRLLLNRTCIGCGTTRAVWSVLHFKFIEAYEYNKMIPITFPLLAGCIAVWVFRNHGKTGVKKFGPQASGLPALTGARNERGSG